MPRLIVEAEVVRLDPTPGVLWPQWRATGRRRYHVGRFSTPWLALGSRGQRIAAGAWRAAEWAMATAKRVGV